MGSYSPDEEILGATVFSPSSSGLLSSCILTRLLFRIG